MIKRFVLGSFLCAYALVASAVLQPTVWADIPDVAPLRVGDTYYLTSTTMHFNPGIPVMASKDLVDWKIISYCYDTIENRDEDNLANGKNDYNFGTWASSIRYNEADGCFYVSSFNQRAKHTYLFRAKKPEGPWERFAFTDRLVYDHSLWIEPPSPEAPEAKGRFYFFGTDKGNVYLHRIKNDFSGLEPEPKLVCAKASANVGGGLAEGTQVFEKDGWYYLVNICWPKGRCRLVNVHRSRNLEGPFEEAKVCFENEGIAQGSFIEKPDGSWVAVLFGDRGGVGRVPFVLPVAWRDGWPMVEAKDDYRATKPVPSCVADDDFSAGNLKLEWQWNHNPDNAHWKLADGALQLTTSRVDTDLLTVRNVLTQRTFGPTSEAMVKVDGAALKIGDKAGLALFQHHWGALSLQRTEKGYDIVLDQPSLTTNERSLARPKNGTRTREVLREELGETAVVHLKAVCDFTPFPNSDYRKIPAAQDTGRFSYSLDGKTWTALGEAMPLPYTIPHFTGYRFALFAWATKDAGGTARFDDFTVAAAKPDETMAMDGTNPIVKTRFTPDPAPVVDGDWLYLFTGHDEPQARGYTMRNWGVVRTRDMVHWEDLGLVMGLDTFAWANQRNHAWASQAIKRGNKWYWYVAVQDAKGRDCLAVATADRPEGPWTDPIGKPLVTKGGALIDPSVFIDDDGSAWLFWGNCWEQPGCWYAKLKENMIELAEDPQPVPGQLPGETAFGPDFKRTGGAASRHKRPVCGFEEAPWIYKVGDTYYLEYAANFPEHWAYSTAKSIRGPWTYGGKIMDRAEGTGTIHGGSVFFKGQWYLVYHNATLPGGADCRRSACIEPYTRNADGSIPFIRPTKEGVSRMRTTVTVEKDPAKGHAVPTSLWGIFFEDINWAADGGLNPEMLANGGFDWQQADHQNNPRDEVAWNCVEDGWEPDFRDGGMARLSFQYGAPVHPNTAKHLRIESFGTGRAGVKNRGLDGMWLKPGEPYRLAYDWREIVRDGIDYTLGPWHHETLDFTGSSLPPTPYSLISTPSYDILLEPDGDRATLSLLVKGRRAVEFDNVSLQPTGPNLVRGGLRKDLVDKLADLKPAFVRFPGGCIVEEGDFQHWYDWRRTVGPKERRECIENRWARPGKPYWETFGVGYYEYFRLCEEIGAEPLPICLAGLTCQYQKPALMCDVKDADYFANVILELIEFANGDVNTTWGKVRAEMGHPAPFNLKMVGIGNENWMGEFFDRAEPIAKIIRAKHPEIMLVGSAGPSPDGREFDYAWKRVTKATADLVDEHYYRNPEWFLKSAYRYDTYDRTKPPVYAGEYACHHKVGGRNRNTLWSAICEAAAMTGFERNCDVVEMASYAPLFAREGHDQWSPNLIWFDGTTSWATPNYYVQQLFATYRPEVELPVSIANGDRLYACAGTKGGATIVKLVNAADEPREVSLNLSGAAEVVTLTGEKEEVNVRDDERVKPVMSHLTLETGKPLVLPPRSLTVLTIAPENEKAYLFSYFSDKGFGGRKGEGAGLHLAYSYDGKSWTALNHDEPLLVPEIGQDKLLRDPSICQGPDGTFHMVWTSSWKDRIIGYASSTNLVDWSEQKAIPVMDHEPTARNCWAPELTYNPDDGLFYIYWATTIPGRHAPIAGMDKKEDGLNHRIYLTTTKDFTTFSPTRLWFDPPFSAIDAALVRDEAAEDWIMVVKNENHTPPEKNIRVTRTKDLSAGFPIEVSPSISPSWVEGPTPLFVGDALYVYFDCYTKHRFGAVRSLDRGKTWTDVSDEVSFPKGIRHGTAFAVDKAVVDELIRRLK